MSISTGDQPSTGYIYDTNAVIYQINGDDAPRNLIGTQKAFVSVISVGELHFGEEKSQRTADNKLMLSRFLDQVNVLMCDVTTAALYGRIASELRRKGRPIPQNDIWIAAIALQYDLTLVTRDAHFAQVDDLKTYSW